MEITITIEDQETGMTVFSSKSHSIEMAVESLYKFEGEQMRKREREIINETNDADA